MPLTPAPTTAAVSAFERAVQTHRFSENEYLVDTWFWIARSHLKRNDSQQARPYLEKIAASDVKYDKKPQAVEFERFDARTPVRQVSDRLHRRLGRPDRYGLR